MAKTSKKTGSSKQNTNKSAKATQTLTKSVPSAEKGADALKALQEAQEQESKAASNATETNSVSEEGTGEAGQPKATENAAQAELAPNPQEEDSTSKEEQEGDAANEKLKEADCVSTIFGFDTSKVGLNYPQTRSRLAFAIRKAGKSLEKRMHSTSDIHLEDVALHLQVLINKLEARIDKRPFAHRGKK